MPAADLYLEVNVLLEFWELQITIHGDRVVNWIIVPAQCYN